jgi:DNA-binding NarL/FixJ family response regulator
MQINQVMTSNVRISNPKQSIRDAAAIMGQIDAGFLPVGEKDRLVGMITDRDIAVRAVGAGKPFFSPAVTAVLVEDYIRRLQHRGLTDSYHLLTDREKEVLQLLAEGRSNKEVATLLNLGLSTVETHRANLMQKLNLHNTAEIVLYAVRKGLIV